MPPLLMVLLLSLLLAAGLVVAQRHGFHTQVGEALNQLLNQAMPCCAQVSPSHRISRQ